HYHSCSLKNLHAQYTASCTNAFYDRNCLYDKRYAQTLHRHQMPPKQVFACLKFHQVCFELLSGRIISSDWHQWTCTQKARSPKPYNSLSAVCSLKIFLNL